MKLLHSSSGSSHLYILYTLYIYHHPPKIIASFFNSITSINDVYACVSPDKKQFAINKNTNVRPNIVKLLKEKQGKYFKYKHLTINIKGEHEPEREQKREEM